MLDENNCGITPAYAGKSGPPPSMRRWSAGSPPRMRGKVSALHRALFCIGITPAYAGKSRTRRCWTKTTAGSPPRMRGKASGPGVLSSLSGITPAYAGKSSFLLPSGNISKDHPRVCGEKWGGILKTIAKGGSPPRMRGKVQVLSHAAQFVGITPAYAGKSLLLVLQPPLRGDHPRVCGEKFSMSSMRAGTLGSPPRMRGKD